MSNKIDNFNVGDNVTIQYTDYDPGINISEKFLMTVTAQVVDYNESRIWVRYGDTDDWFYWRQIKALSVIQPSNNDPSRYNKPLL